jgi:AhpD family alkylhydroperoxidase
MQARMNHPVMIFPDAMKAMFALKAATDNSGLSETTVQMVHLRASQINGCSVCVEMHAEQLRQGGESLERILTVAAWRDAPYFTDAERAALELAECVTRLSDRPDPVPEEVWVRATAHYNEKQMAALLLSLAAINVWNRLNVATAQVAGEWKKSAEVRKLVEEQAFARQ